MKKLMMLSAAFSGITLLTACAGSTSSSSKEIVSHDTLTMLVGSYASPEEEGIRVYQFNQETGESRYCSGFTGISNPSYLTFSSDGATVYAVGEDETAETSTANALSFCQKKLKLSRLNSQLTHGGAPCHITVSPDQRFVVTANYLGGSITVFPLGESGKLEKGEVVKFDGNGPDFARQEQSHLHYIYFTPDGRYLLANDLGADCIHVFPILKDKKDEACDSAGASSGRYLDTLNAFDVRLKPGSGPRHACFDAQGKSVYLITELSGEVIVLSYRGHTLTPVQTIQADTLGARGSADIHLSPDGKFLYASNRLKADGIAIFKVDTQSGLLTRVGYQPTGIHPRNFMLTPNGKFLLAACRDTNEIQIYLRNTETGLLHDTGKRISMQKPVCICWYPAVG